MLNFTEENIKNWALNGTSGVFGLTLLDLASKDDKICTVTTDSTVLAGLTEFEKKYKNRFYNVGIAEQTQIGVAGGLASEGYDVFLPAYADFTITRALDQMRITMGYMKMPIKIFSLDSGLTDGKLGATHMAIEDIGIIRSIPNIVILSPADTTELMKMMINLQGFDRPVYVSVKLNNCYPIPLVHKKDYNYEIGKIEKVYENKNAKIVIFATGPMVDTAIKASEKLKENNIFVEVVNIHTLKPFNNDIVKEYLSKKVFITIEEHNVIGGLYDIILESLQDLKTYKEVYKIGIDDFYPFAGSYEEIIKHVELDVESIINKITKIYNKVFEGR